MPDVFLFLDGFFPGDLQSVQKYVLLGSPPIQHKSKKSYGWCCIQNILYQYKSIYVIALWIESGKEDFT